MVFPIQKLSTKEKFKANETTGLNNIEETAKYYLENGTYNNEDYYEILRLFSLLDDEIDESLYKYVLNPFNTKEKKYTKFRGKLRNYNIIAPVVELYKSEFGRRNHNPIVLQSNPDDVTAKDKALTDFYRQYRQQNAINALNKAGFNTGRDTQSQKPLKQAKEEFLRTYKEEKVVSGQEALNYIRYKKDLDDKYIDLYENYLVCGRPITYKGINHNDIEFDIISPLEGRFPHDTQNPRLEDRDWFIRYDRKTPSQVLDFHGNRLSDDLVEALSEQQDTDYAFNKLGTSDGMLYMSDEDFNSKYKHYYARTDNSVVHSHVVFKSFKKIGILTYQNAIGELIEIEVEDSYKLDKNIGDISIQYEYRNAVYETWYIEFNGVEEFVDTKELDYDRSEVNNNSRIKLPYNGLALCTKSGEIKSLVKSGQNYQIIYNVLKFNFEKLINKNKDKLSIIPLGLLNKGKQGWDEEKAMYYAEANSTLFIDETSPNAALALQGIKVLDMSLGKYVGEVIGFAEQIKADWWDNIGMNRQRFGETKASDGKANNEQAIFRSSLISEDLLRRFEKFQEKDYEGLLDLSKIAWANGTKGDYILSDGNKALFEINADNYNYYLSSDFDVHVIFSGEENKKINDLQAYMFNATQNGMSIIPVLEAMDTNSFTKMKEIIIKEERAREELNQANLEKDRENNKYVEDKRAETENAKLETEKYKANKDYDKAIDVKQMDLNMIDGDRDALLKENEITHKINKENKELDLKEKETDSKINKEESEIKKLEKETSLMNNQKINN